MSNPLGPAARGNPRVAESAGSISAFSTANLRPSQHPAFAGGDAGGAVAMIVGPTGAMVPGPVGPPLPPPQSAETNPCSRPCAIFAGRPQNPTRKD
jgi:hypothetical protein